MTHKPSDNNLNQVTPNAAQPIEGHLHIRDAMVEPASQSRQLPRAPHNSPNMRSTPEIHKAKRRTWPLQDTGRRLFSLDARKTGDFSKTTLNLEAKLELPGQLRILIVDDEKVNRLILNRNTQRALNNCDEHSYSIAQAENGQVAIKMFEAARARNEAFHVIIMDNTMPVMTGSEAIKAIRPLDDQVLFLIHTTDDIATRQKMLELASPHAIALAKPCPPEDITKALLNVVNKLMRGMRQTDLSEALKALHQSAFVNGTLVDKTRSPNTPDRLKPH